MSQSLPSEEVTALSRIEPDQAVEQVRALDTLDAIYRVWDELRAAWRARQEVQTQAWQRLEGEGSFLVGAVRAAGGVEPSAGSDLLMRTDAGALDAFLEAAEARLGAARDALSASAREEERSFRSAFAELERLLEERVQRYAARAPPSLVLWRRPVGKDRAVLHLERVGLDASVILLHRATGKLAAHHDFLEDDRTDSPDLEPSSFYREEGLTAVDERPRPVRFPELCRREGRVSAVKGFLPFFAPLPEGGETFYRFRQRGPVLEAELLDPVGLFRSVLSQTEAERLAGLLLRWKLSGALQLRLETG
jgi:hypothetical protein